MMKKYCGYYHSPIGILEIICSEDALQSIMFVESERLAINETNYILKHTIIQLKEYFNGSRRDFDLKLSFEGTDFQKKIWNELLQIPFGETISYKDLAVKAGCEGSARAVGNANGKNNLLVIVPCHRVIGSNGNLTGYAGRIDRKRWLLEHEQEMKRKDKEIRELLQKI